MIRTFILSMLIPVAVFGQERITPGTMYQSGQKLLGPKFGVVTQVPDNWVGILPHDIEMFLLMSTQDQDGQILAMGTSDNPENIRKSWETGSLESETGITMKMKGGVSERNGNLTAEFEITGNMGRSNKAYAEAKCGEYGNCVIFLLIAPENFYNSFKDGLMSFADNTTFEEPSLDNIYQNFNWPEFLNNKYLATYDSNRDYKRDNQLWLCPDGTFRIRIKNKNWGSVPQAYQGTNTGVYEVKGIGPKGEISLEFKKLDPITIDVEIKEDKIYVNSSRFYVMQNTECR